jgi:hypothetical protein
MRNIDMTNFKDRTLNYYNENADAFVAGTVGGTFGRRRIDFCIDLMMVTIFLILDVVQVEIQNIS